VAKRATSREIANPFGCGASNLEQHKIALERSDFAGRKVSASPIAG